MFPVNVKALLFLSKKNRSMGYKIVLARLKASIFLRDRKPFFGTNLEHQTVSDFGGRDVVAVRVADSHIASGRRASVGDGSSRRQGLHVEAEVKVLFRIRSPIVVLKPCGFGYLFARVVDTANSVGLSLVRHQLGMFLHDEDEPGLALVVEQAASVEFDL